MGININYNDKPMKLRENDTGRSTADQMNEQAIPGGYRVDDDKNLDEKDLKTHYLFGDSTVKDGNAPGMEGEGMGGQSFGQNNVTPAGDARPSQYAGYDNAYLNRTEPAQEHPENNNFKSAEQQGAPNYTQAQPKAEGGNENIKEERESGDSGANQPAPNTYQEGTSDNDGKGNGEPNIPGPGELPDQQKVGEDNDGDHHPHIET